MTKHRVPLRTLSLSLLVVACALPRLARAQTLPDYVPLLPAAKERAIPVDPKKGYAVRQLKPGVYMITEGSYESMFVTTGLGVVLFDAPPTLARFISQAVAETTREHIVELVYSHVHVDHIAGAGLLLKEHPDMKILGEEGTVRFLTEVQDPNRPVPGITFKAPYTLRVGSLIANITVGHWHTPEGDLLISIPEKKVVMAVDAFSAGATPFMGLDLTQDMHAYLKFFDQLNAMDFDVIVPGHHDAVATKEDLVVAQSYVMDVYHTVARIVAKDHRALKTRAVQKYHDNIWAVASVLIQDEVNECAAEITPRWVTRLEGVDIWAKSHCQTALVYATWDIGPR